MKQAAALLLSALLLCGCAIPPSPNPSAEESVPASEISAEAAPEPTIQGQLRCYPLENICCTGLLPWGQDLLALCQDGPVSRLCLLAADSLRIKAQTRLPGAVTEQALHLCENTLSFYDAQARQTVVLNRTLEEQLRIDSPEDLVGAPLLSPDGETLFYCAPEALMALDLPSGIRSVLKAELSQPLALEALLLEGTVILSKTWDPHWGTRQLLLSAETGAILADLPREGTILAEKEQYYYSRPDGCARALVFGIPGEAPQALYPRSHQADCQFLPQTQGAVTLEFTRDNTGLQMDYYSLETGLLEASLVLPAASSPRSLCSTGEGVLWFLLYDPEPGCDVLCRWDTREHLLQLPRQYTGPHYTAQNPDLAGLDRCREQALELGQRYGLRILVARDPLEPGPGDYRLEPEHRADLIQWALSQLDSWLARFPPDFFRQLAGSGEEVRICLVRGITGREGTGGLESAQGIQFQGEHGCCIALALGQEMEAALYHELSHCIDTRVFACCGVYDNWNSLNPRDFTYDYDYAASQARQDDPYLREERRAFVDRYSMSFPNEDRARILEYAMTEGNAQLFQAPILQRKLLTICTGIREAFHLEDTTETLPWEQYLTVPWSPAE